MTNDPGLWMEIFNQRGGLLLFFGALGGATNCAVFKTSWRECLRVVFVGGSFSFGLGTLGPLVMKPWIGDLPETSHGDIGALCGAAYMTGLLCMTIIEKWVDTAKKESEK
ncbi:MAG: hypothetical protein ACPG61_07090 [Paracoccaceae bacterium]